MLHRLGESLSAFFRATAPDPFVIAILLTMLTFLLGWTVSDGPPADLETSTPLWLLDQWQGGFWNLLAFAMQMCLILVTGHALASSKPVASVLGRVAGVPRTARQAVALTAAIAMSAGLVNWGFGLIVGAILARDVERSLRSRGVRTPAGLLPAAGYTCMLTWHGGLSGSAPLKATDEAGQIDVLGPDLAAQIGAIPVNGSLFGTLNLIATPGLMLLVIGLLMLLCPSGHMDDATPAPVKETERRDDGIEADDLGVVPRFLERSFVAAWLLAAPAVIYLAVRFGADGFAALTLNTANLAFLALGLIMHGSTRSYGRAVEDGVRGCAGIIIQFPLYAGIMGIMSGTGMARDFSQWLVDLAGGREAGLAASTFASAGLVNLFVPSGGGQWAIQGPIAMQAAADAGASPSKLLMAVAYGDQLTNMLQPFWALPLLGICRARAQDVVGYTAIIMLVAAVWLVGCLVLL